MLFFQLTTPLVHISVTLKFLVGSVNVIRLNLLQNEKQSKDLYILIFHVIILLKGVFKII